jgi:uncharacterized membrane protein YhiD involved in acid resistance
VKNTQVEEGTNMYKYFLKIIKYSLIALLIIVLANWIQWKGKTVSDQIKTQMAQAEQSTIFKKAQHWKNSVSVDIKKGVIVKLHNEQIKLMNSLDETKSKQVETKEIIPSTEKEKLRSLIQDLNTSPGKAH